MTLVKVHDKQFVPYLSEAEIQQKIKEVAGRINKDYKERKPLFIAILNGSFMFAADLLKTLPLTQRSAL